MHDTPNRMTNLIASTASDQLKHLEALFNALRERLDDETYEHSLADLGQNVASNYATEMLRLVNQEVRHG